MEPANPVDLSDKILTLIKNPELRKAMATNNRGIVQTRFNAEIFAHGLAEIWNSVLAAGVTVKKEGLTK